MFVSDFNGNGTLELNEFFMKGSAVVLATPEIAGLPYVISGLVAAGGIYLQQQLVQILHKVIQQSQVLLIQQHYLS